MLKRQGLEERLVFDPTLIVDHMLLTNLQKMKRPSQGTTLFLVISLTQVLLNILKDLVGHTQNRIVIFGNSITRRIRVTDLSRELNTGNAKIGNFPGAVLKEFPHHVTPTLEDGNFDVAILRSPTK